MAFHGLPERSAQHLPERKTDDLSRPGTSGGARERAAGALRETRGPGSERLSPQDPGHASGPATGSAAIEISKRPQLPGDQRNHEALREQRRRAHPQRLENSAATLRAGVPGFPAVHTPNRLMKINLDDPNLTAFALGELPPTEHAKMAAAVAASPEAQSFVAETQQLSRMLRAEYEADRVSPVIEADPRPHLSTNIIPMEERPHFLMRRQWGSIAAILAIFAVIAAVAVTTIHREAGRVSQRPPSPTSAPERINLPPPVEAAPEPTVEMEFAEAAAAGNLGAIRVNPAAPPPTLHAF